MRSKSKLVNGQIGRTLVYDLTDYVDFYLNIGENKQRKKESIDL